MIQKGGEGAKGGGKSAGQATSVLSGGQNVGGVNVDSANTGSHKSQNQSSDVGDLGLESFDAGDQVLDADLVNFENIQNQGKEIDFGSLTGVELVRVLAKFLLDLFTKVLTSLAAALDDKDDIEKEEAINSDNIDDLQDDTGIEDVEDLNQTNIVRQGKRGP